MRRDVKSFVIIKIGRKKPPTNVRSEMEVVSNFVESKNCAKDENCESAYSNG